MPNLYFLSEDFVKEIYDRHFKDNTGVAYKVDITPGHDASYQTLREIKEILRENGYNPLNALKFGYNLKTNMFVFEED